jgi:hypothetical protein
MPSNPFKRSQSPFEQTRDRIDNARRGVAQTARGVRDGADKLASALDDSQDAHRGRSSSLFAAGAAALLGAAYVGAKRLGVASAVTKRLGDVRSGVTEAAGGGGDAAASDGTPPGVSAPTGAAGAPTSG